MDRYQAGFPIGRIVLDFGESKSKKQDPRGDLSAVASDAEGALWLASDEMWGVSRLLPCGRGLYGRHRHLELEDALALPAHDEEMDIEGMDIAGGVLWLVGSHTGTRKKVKRGKSDIENLHRLARVERRRNRFVIAKLAVAPAPEGAGDLKGAARLPIGEAGNALTEALGDDPHLGPFVQGLEGLPLASKENGLDLEGVAVRDDRLFLGLRGPVLGGYALLLEIALEEDAGDLRLTPIGKGSALYRKHFIDLSGMGVRDLVWRGDDLLILSGPTMDLAGRQCLYRLEGAAELTGDSITGRDQGRLTPLFELPGAGDRDKAEGLALFDGLGEGGLLVVYDAPREERLVGDDAVLADVFCLPGK